MRGRIREELRQMCRHIAEQGYVVILPDLYYREGTVRFDLSKGEEELQRMFAMGSKLTVDMIMRATIDPLNLSELDGGAATTR